MSDFHITPEHATDLAQSFHHYHENGELDEEGAIEAMADQYAEWLRENINWNKILDDDEDAAEFARERAEAEKGEY